jgi:hypothetical protein
MPSAGTISARTHSKSAVLLDPFQPSESIDASASRKP